MLVAEYWSLGAFIKNLKMSNESGNLMMVLVEGRKLLLLADNGFSRGRKLLADNGISRGKEAAS